MLCSVYPSQFLFFLFIWVRRKEFDPKCCEVILSVYLISSLINCLHYDTFNKNNVTFIFNMGVHHGGTGIKRN